MSNMKVIIEVEKNFLEIQNADTATATAAVRSFCNMLKTKTPGVSSAKIIVEPKKQELPENPNDRIPVSAASLKALTSERTPKPPYQNRTEPIPVVVGDRPGAQTITELELGNLQYALDNREKMVLMNGEPGVLETIRFTNTEPRIPLYRSQYKCPTCTHEGTRYVRETNIFLKCHRCESQIALDKTVPNSEFMESNEAGFFFTATKLVGRYNNMMHQQPYPQLY